MKETLIGIDFSINKPAICILKDNKYEFLSAPFGLSKKNIDLFKNSGINIIERTDKKYKGTDSSEKMRWEVQNAIYLSNLLVFNLFKYKFNPQNTKIIFEGFSYSSSGKMALQLGGYKYILMSIFNEYDIKYENMITYPPISIKKTADCARKGMGKKEMIDAFIKNSNKNILKKNLLNNRKKFLKKTGKYIDHLDDLVDAYWAIETYLEKN